MVRKECELPPFRISFLPDANSARFLWVAFQIEDICSQCNDEDIRRALRILPKDLTETFNRALLRVLANRNAKIAKQVFRWVAAAKRPLSLNELREALAVEPCQPYSKPERLVNHMSRVTAWCENLVVVDEEDGLVQFAHHTVKEHFLGEPSDQQLIEFHFQLVDANHEVGEICVTYLNFNDFKTQLIRRPKSRPAITASAIAETAIGNQFYSATAASLVRSMVMKGSSKGKGIDVAQKLAGHIENSKEKLFEKFQPNHPFLDYASKYWLLHTTTFNKSESKTWNLWARLLLDERSLAQVPWTPTQFLGRDFQFLGFICDEHHEALLRYIQSSDQKFQPLERLHLIHDMSWPGEFKLLDAFLETDHLAVDELVQLLKSAITMGQLQAVDMMLAVVQSDVNACDSEGRTALHVAVFYNYLEVVDRLLAADAHINARTRIGETALHIAAKEGFLDMMDKLIRANIDIDVRSVYGETALDAAIVNDQSQVLGRLLTAGADINSCDSIGWTSLHRATSWNRFQAVDMLLTANAFINARTGNGETALHLAAEKGHLDIVDKLIRANIDIDARSTGGLTAVVAAIMEGHSQVLERLLIAGADINSCDYIGWTALHRATSRNRFEAVNMLLAANAFINALTHRGETALHLAAEQGHLDMVDKLIRANIDIDARTNLGHTAMDLASSIGFSKVVNRLKLAGGQI